MPPSNPDKKSIREWLISAALERQILGLSPAEYNALTPSEISAELEAAKILERRRDSFIEMLDEHFARLELLLNGYTFPDAKNTEDFRILKRRTSTPSEKQRKANTIKNIKMAIKMRTLVDKIRRERDAKRALKKRER